MKERSIDTPATLRFVTAGSARTDPARAKSVSVAVAPASQGGPRSDPAGAGGKVQTARLLIAGEPPQAASPVSG
jgi:hypothetical protein